jgi:hypothetical protein
MAGVALHRFVSVDQSIVCLVVIKSLTIELHDVSIAAFVLGMAGPTVAIQSVRLPSVKTDMRLAISRYFLMAIQTQFRLRGPRKSFVTLFALALKS